MHEVILLTYFFGFVVVLFRSADILHDNEIVSNIGSFEEAMMKIVIFMVVMLLKYVQCRRFGVIGGVQTTISKSPYQLAFLFNGKLKCGASIISDTFGLTAAHCTAQYPVNVTVRAGSTMKSLGGEIIKVIKIYNHPSFDRVKLVNDFALLEFEKPLELSDLIQPVKLPDEGDNFDDGTECTVSGWGKMDNDEKPTELRSVTVYIINQDICQKNYNTTEVKFRLTSVMLCAGFPDGGRDGECLTNLIKISLKMCF